MRRGLLLALAGLLLFASSPFAAEKHPAASSLPASKALPNPLVMMDGRVIATAAQWRNERRPQLVDLFQHYMYGRLPKAAPIQPRIVATDRQYLNGTATKKQVLIHFADNSAPPIDLLLVIPNRRTGKVPVFVGMNFCGNHQLLDDPTIPLPKVWMPERCPGCQGNVASEEGRGKQVSVWNIEQTIGRGYAVATFYSGDVDPDKVDANDGIQPHFAKLLQNVPVEEQWGTIAAWAYGVHRAVDYLVTDDDLDGQRIAVVGHSRLGKVALLAAALDERIAMALPLQAGCGGTAPSRGEVGESVKAINDRFPHWFGAHFKEFNEQPERLPFDQHALVALVAPRPVLFANAQEDTWANPAGQFEVLRAADPVYRLLGVEGLGVSSMPELNQLVASRLGYYIRAGKHSMNADDWRVFCDFADRHWPR